MVFRTKVGLATLPCVCHVSSNTAKALVSTKLYSHKEEVLTTWADELPLRVARACTKWPIGFDPTKDTARMSGWSQIKLTESFVP